MYNHGKWCRVEKTRTVGWASELLDAWKEALKPKKETQKAPKVSFYGIRKVLHPVESATNVPSNKAMFRRLTKSGSACLPGEKKRGISEDLADHQDSKRIKKDCEIKIRVSNQWEKDLLDMYKF